MGLVSIGMPVYNGGRYLRGAIDSLLAQAYSNFEIIISDNGSNDETQTICREYADHDPRIRYHRAQKNRGPAWNFKRVYDLAQGEYFARAAHDDRRDPRYLSLCVLMLEQNPQALMCCVDARIIDEEGGDITETVAARMFHPTGQTPFERVSRIASSTLWLDICSLFRTPVLAQTRFGRINVFGGDVVIVTEVCLRGAVVAVPQKLIDYRYIPRTIQEVTDNLSTDVEKVVATWGGLIAELVTSVRLSPLGLMQKLKIAQMLVVNFSLHNVNVSPVLKDEGWDDARRAFSGRDYYRLATLTYIRFLIRSPEIIAAFWKHCREIFARVNDSARYRGGRLKKALMARARKDPPA